MWLCDYITDIGIVQRRIRPYIYGIEESTGDILPTGTVINRLGQYVPMDGYYEETGKVGYCKKSGRARKLVVQDRNNYYVVDYWQPFGDLDWTVFSDLDIRVETIPEFLNHAQVNQQLRQWYSINNA